MCKAKTFIQLLNQINELDAELVHLIRHVRE